MSRLKLLLKYCLTVTEWRQILGSSTSCLMMFFLGACMTLCLTSLPDRRMLLLVCIVASLFGIRFARLRVLVFLIFGFSYTCLSFQSFSNASFPSDYERVDFVASGVVEGLPLSNAGNIRFRFKVDTVSNTKISILSGRLIQASCYRCPFSIRAGDHWRLTLRVKRPRGYASWGAFDYEKYLFRHQIIAKGYVRLKGENQRLTADQNTIHGWRQYLLDELQSAVDQSVGGSIIAALTIGVKSGFTNKQKQVLQVTGVSHLMAISGLHVGLVFTGVVFLLKWLLWPMAYFFERCPRQRLVLPPAFLAATSYAALAGFSVSTQRALVMLAVYVLCKFLARETSLFKVLLIAIVLLLIVDPFSILDIGFWLSCSAVAIIALAAAGNESLALTRLQPKLWLGMLPLSVIFFGQVSLVSPLVNLVAVPLFCIVLIPATLLMILIFCLGAKGVGAWGLEKLGEVFDITFGVLEVISQFEFSKVYATPLVWWQWLIFLLLMLSYLKPARIKWLFSILLIWSVFINTSRVLANDELYIALLDVGQGLAMVIETPNTVTVYDTGPRYGTGFTAAEAVLLPFLRQRGIRRIDTLVISHADNDHIGGLGVLRGAFDIGQTISSRPDKVSNARECIAGQSWRYDQTVFKVISPQPETPSGSNNRSCVIMLEHQGTRVLLSGDVEKQVERFLVKNFAQQLNADVLLVPHQGSKTSSTADFIDTVSPRLAIVAAGYKNHYGHPHPEVVKRYVARDIELLSTIDNGSVLLKVNSQGLSKVLYRQRYRRFWNYQKLPNEAQVW